MNPQPQGVFQGGISGSGSSPVGAVGGHSAGSGITHNTPQRGYEIIKDSLNKVKLPEDLHVFDSKSGISRDCQQNLTTISKCARYTETALKQLSVMVDADPAPSPEFQK